MPCNPWFSLHAYAVQGKTSEAALLVHFVLSPWTGTFIYFPFDFLSRHSGSYSLTTQLRSFMKLSFPWYLILTCLTFLSLSIPSFLEIIPCVCLLRLILRWGSSPGLSCWCQWGLAEVSCWRVAMHDSYFSLSALSDLNSSTYTSE